MTNKKLFWILQLVGWGSLASINGWAKIVSRKELNASYIIIESLLFFIFGILASLSTRQYLKGKINYDNFQTKNIKHITISLLIGTLVLFSLLLSLLFFNDLLNDKKQELTNLIIILNGLNSFLYILFWLLFYLSIKISQKFRKNKIERLELESSLKESQLNTLIGQINPHFMFNSLNNIRGLMLEDVDKSREMITRLSYMLRYSLTKNNTHKIAITEELEMVENYIELSKIQLENRLEFKKEIDNSILGIEIPPMIIQMLIENAVKHGISNLPQGGLIMLKVLKKEKQLIIRVCNSGKRIINNNSTKVGLENIKKRLSLIYGNDSEFLLSEKEDMVTAMIKIPLQND